MDPEASAAGRKIGAIHYPPEKREECFQLRKQDLSFEEVSNRSGVPRVTIQRWADKFKWNARIRLERGAKQAGEHLQPSDMSFAEKQDKFTEGMATQALRLPEIMQGMDDEELIQKADKIKNLEAIARKALRLEDAKPANVINVTLLSRPVPAQVVDAPTALALPDVEAEVVEAPEPETVLEK